MRIFWPIGTLLACLGAGLAMAAPAASPTCGVPGRPACPLQEWMRVHAAAPLATQDFGALEQSFQRIAQLNPDPGKWGNWSKIAGDGAAAARGRDLGDARSACGRCHRAYRRAYNARYRTRTVGDP